MSNTILKAQARTSMWLSDVVDRMRDREFGQGSAEYAGVIVVAVVLVGALITAAKGTWGRTLVAGITAKLAKIFT